jgi:geranylgeranyl diphosphate synthase type II
VNDFNLAYEKYQSVFEVYAMEYASKMKTKPEILGDSIRYSFLNGGKRVRPVLALACADVLGVSQEDILPYALALEMIHTYSLIHDDLPAMDNDDYRRGKPSNHKQFGEDNAILAGDGLLNEAYRICFGQCVKGEKYVLAAKYLNDCAGIYGMIAGQSADLYYSAKNDEEEETLWYIQECKTGKLLLAPVAIASILADNKDFFALENFGRMLGRLFQMTDDILDVTGEADLLGKTVGKDEKENKLTTVKIYGLDGAKVRAEECAQDCFAILEGISGDTEFLKGLVEYVLTRKH